MLWSSRAYFARLRAGRLLAPTTCALRIALELVLCTAAVYEALSGLRDFVGKILIRSNALAVLSGPTDRHGN